MEIKLDTALSDIKEKIKISTLVTSIYYSLDFVFIIFDGSNFHLVVIHKDQLLTYSTYDSVKGAKIAFSRLYSYKVWNDGIKPDWSSFYNPTPDWLNEQWKILKKVLPAPFNYLSNTGE